MTKRVRSFRNGMLAAGALLFSLFSVVSIEASAQDMMPKAAPDLHLHHPSPSENDTTSSASIRSTRVTVRSSQASEPLTGAVNRFDGSLTGSTSIIQTPEALSAVVSKKVPPEMFRAWLTKSHPAFALSANQLPQNSVLEVQGRWDQAGRTLKSLGIPFESVKSHELSQMPLTGVKVLVVNCAGSVPKNSLQRIRDFVAGGGYLLTTDWGLDNLVEKAFPGYIAWDRRKNDKPIYDAYVVNPDPVLFAYTVTNAHWKMDEDSHLLRVLKPDAVRVLARSRQLAREDAAGEGVLAVTFPFGRGHVLHLVGHFDNNAALLFTNSLPDPAPVINISLRQAIAANFVVAGLSGAGNSF